MTTQSPNRLGYYQRIYRDASSTNFELSPHLKTVLQPVTASGVKLGRPILWGSNTHEFLMKHMSKLFPRPDDYRPKRRQKRSVDVTRNFYKSDWVNLGFSTRKEGQIFIKRFRQRGEDLSSLDRVRAIVEQHREYFALNQPELVARAHKGFQSTFRVTHRGHTPHYTAYLSDLSSMIDKLIRSHTHGEPRPVNIQVRAQVVMQTTEGESSNFWMPGTTELILPGSGVLEAISSLMLQVDGFTREKSGMIFDDFLSTYIDIVDAELVTGSSYIPLPEELAGPQKKLINPKNESDNLCFLYAIIALLHYDEIGRDHQRVSKLRRFLPRYKFDEGDFPMAADKRKIGKYEEVFQCNINLLMHTEGKGSLAKRISPLYASRSSYDCEVNLLLIGSEDNTHYVGIRDLSALLSSCGSSSDHKHFYCLKCLHATTSASDYETHKKDCGSNLQKVSMPDSLKRKKDETDWEFAERLKKTKQKCNFHFRGFSKTIPIPVVIYADQEAFQLKSDDPKCKHLPQEVNSCAYVAVDFYKKVIVKEFIAYGDKSVREMLDSIKELSEKIFEEYFLEAKQMKISPRDQEKFVKLLGAHKNKAAHMLKDMGRCCLCDKHFSPSGSGPVRHHNHYTGEYLGIAHSNCNLKARSPTLIDVVHHNFKGYDSHAIIRELKPEDYERVDIVPDNEEKWKSFTLTFEHPEKRRQKGVKPPGRIVRDEVVRLESGEEVHSPKLFYRHIDYIKEAKEVNRHNKLCQHKLRFIDSLAFLSASLDNVTKSLKDEEFRYTRQFAGGDEDFQLLRKKGFYPYEYMEGPARFEETELPPMSAFVSRLSHGTSDIRKLSQEDLDELRKGYAHGKKVWEHFGMKTMRDYHELYLKTDIFILADVFERFRELSMDSFGLDPAHYITLPSMGLDACLKLTKANLELMTDPSMYLFCEEAKIGGVSSVFSKRFAKAFNSYLEPGHDNTSPETNYIQYVDKNSLYAFSMMQKLPVGGFKWLENVADFNPLRTIARQIGYFVEVDAHLPRCVTLCKEYKLWKSRKPIDRELKTFYESFDDHMHEEGCTCLHDHQADYPAFPEMICPTKDMLSPKQQGGKDCTTPKLVPNLMDKSRYKIHLEVLQYWMRCGWEVTKIHRVLQFRQSPWMAPYIQHCIDMRKQAKTEFEKDFWKLLCNAVFGKTMEDVRRHSRVVLLSATEEEAKFKRLTKHNAIRKGPLPQHIAGDMYSINVVKSRVTLNKPIYAGVAILALSKLFMHQFWYGVLKPMYGSDLHLLYSDTDSFIYQVYCEDHYQDLTLIKEQFDFSNFPEDHPLYDTKNKKVPGLMKSETADVPISEFCGIRSKMYSIKTLKPFSKDGKMVDKVCTGKGIWKKILSDLRHDDYKRCIFHEGKSENMVQRARMYNLQPKNHVVHLIQTDKITLSTHDDKRYLLDDGVTQLPFGHAKLPLNPVYSD